MTTRMHHNSQNTASAPRQGTIAARRTIPPRPPRAAARTTTRGRLTLWTNPAIPRRGSVTPAPAPPTPPRAEERSLPPDSTIARGVYSYTEPITGVTLYYAVTSRRTVVPGTPRAQGADETAAQTIRDVWRALDRQDPQRTLRPALALVGDV